MDVNAVQQSIRKFLKKHKQAFFTISSNQSKALELAVTVGVAEHYRSVGYTIHVVNPKKSPQTFVVKTSTRGHPWNFTHLKFERHDVIYEGHMNLVVESAHDEGRYCVDFGLIKTGCVPDKAMKTAWSAAKNKDLVTFAEVKKLVVYPMLLAQFLGIVHEIKPCFIHGRTPRGFGREDHLYPVLASLGNFSGNSSKIVEAYKTRRVRVLVAENFDLRLAGVRSGRQESPFVYADEFEDEI
ncbi:hypothetical protein CGX12_17975 [Zobellella denitrificans]|uniref:hypothetical protein n=1 Tax=Zobellella denitrificans TaxID=347534 RepID=UPI000B8BE9F0|nr:hypothetical protein [Zobellella denitrificans]OXS13763.1 hypothetical protein CGX12_17975 [Zobellella denitrificans]